MHKIQPITTQHLKRCPVRLGHWSDKTITMKYYTNKQMTFDEAILKIKRIQRNEHNIDNIMYLMRIVIKNNSFQTDEKSHQNS